MFKNVILVEKDEILSENLTSQLLDYLGNKCNISTINNFKSIDNFKAFSIDLVIVNYIIISKEFNFLKELEKNITPNIIIIFDNVKNRYENKNFINYKFVVKPFTLKNLYSIISNFQSIVKKDKDKDKHKINLLKHLSFIPNSKIIKNDKTNKIVHLTEKETYLIEFLFKNKNQFVSKKELLNNVWGINETINTHTLETHIYRLRKKIERIENNIDFNILKDKGGYFLKS